MYHCRQFQLPHYR